MFLTWYTNNSILDIMCSVKVLKIGVPIMNVPSQKQTPQLRVFPQKLFWECFWSRSGTKSNSAAWKWCFQVTTTLKTAISESENASASFVLPRQFHLSKRWISVLERFQTSYKTFLKSVGSSKQLSLRSSTFWSNKTFTISTTKIKDLNWAHNVRFVYQVKNMDS